MSALPKLALEQSNDSDSLALQRLQSLDNLCWLSLHKVAERYLGGDFNVFLELSDNCRGNWIVSIKRCCGVHGGTAQIEDGQREGKFSVLEDSVQVMNDPDGTIKRIGSKIRLKRSNQVASVGARNHLYFSLRTGRFAFFGADGELDLCRVIAPRDGHRQLPGDVIQTGSKVVNNLTGEYREPDRDNQSAVVLGLLAKHLKVLITDDWVLVVLDEGSNLGIQVDDVLIGPLENFVDAFKSVCHGSIISA